MRPAESFEGRPFGRRSRRPAGGPLVIEGEAVVIGPRGGPRRAPDDVGGPARPGGRSAGACAAPFAAETAASRRGETPDLIFAGLGAAPASGRPGARPGGRAGGLVPLAGGLSAALFATVAVAFAAMPGTGPAEAPALSALAGRSSIAVATASIEGIRLSEVIGEAAPHGAGTVLSVEGVIENAGGAARGVPPLRLTLVSADGGRQSRPLVPVAGELSPGRKVRFQTMIAVPDGALAGAALSLVFEGSPS